MFGYKHTYNTTRDKEKVCVSRYIYPYDKVRHVMQVLIIV